MTSNGKIMWTKVVRIIEMNNFGFWTILIRDHIQLVEPKYIRPCVDGRFWFRQKQKLTSTSTSRVLWNLINSEPIQTYFGTINIRPSRRTRIENRKTWKFFVFSRRTTLSSARFWLEVVYFLENDPQGAVSFQNEQFWKVRVSHPNWAQIRVLDMDPRPFLAREVQPLLIYMRGDGRLKQHQSNKHIYYFFVFIYFLSLSLVSFFSFFVVLQYWRLRIHEALGAVKPT